MATRKTNNKIALTGAHAVGEALRQVRPDVMAVYPITPQTPIIEYFAKEVADGKLDTEIVTVESEHSAMSACIGASAAGARTVTASSSQGIMYMMETLPIASAMRLPILMAVANRAISGPINIHCDHSDAMAMREHGWIQIFAENVQEAYDNTILGMKMAEQNLLPVTVNMDGFYTSHSVENVSLLDDKTVSKFVGSFVPKNSLLDFKSPQTFGSLALQNSYFEFRIQIYKAMEKAGEVFGKLAKEYENLANEKREEKVKIGFTESYKASDAERVIVAMGSACGTIKEVVDDLRLEKIKAGLLKIRLFRPFPYDEVAVALKNAKEVFVLDRNLVFGSRQALFSEIKHSLAKDEGKVKSLVFGLGGRDISQAQIREVFLGKTKNMFIK
jgi:pyruvate ferredoxin oxidoreductase alpha subunit